MAPLLRFFNLDRHTLRQGSRNQRSFKNMDSRMISEFQTIYDDFLSQFDGLIVIRTPV